MTYKLERTTSPNLSPRIGEPIYLVIHRMQGTFEGSKAWFRNGDSQVSADELISRDGSKVAVLNTPQSGQKCWAVGNANSLAFSFEIEGFVGDEDTLPDNLFDTLADRLDQAADGIFKHYDQKIPLLVTDEKGRPGIVGHHQLAVWYGGSDHTCPGQFPWERLEAAIKDLREPDVPDPEDYVILAGGLPAKIIRSRKAGEGRTSDFLDSIEPETLNKYDRLVITKQTRRRPPVKGKRL